MTAATLFEAVAQGLAAIRGNDGGAGIECGESVGGGAAGGARGAADGIYKMAGTKWRIAARNQRRKEDSRNPRNVDDTVEPAGWNPSLAKMAEMRTGNGRTVALLRFAK